MSETLKAIKTTPYGIMLEDKTFMNTTDIVRDYLSDKLPAELEVQEMQGQKISRVKVLQQAQRPMSALRDDKAVDMMLSYAKDIFVGGKAESLNQAAEMCMEARKLIVLNKDN
jgi:hypothetical protein